MKIILEINMDDEQDRDILLSCITTLVKSITEVANR